MGQVVIEEANSLFAEVLAGNLLLKCLLKMLEKPTNNIGADTVV